MLPLVPLQSAESFCNKTLPFNFKRHPCLCVVVLFSLTTGSAQDKQTRNFATAGQRRWRRGAGSPDNRQKLLLHSKDRQVLPLLHKGLFLRELAAGFALLFHVIGKLLLCPERVKRVVSCSKPLAPCQPLQPATGSFSLLPSEASPAPTGNRQCRHRPRLGSTLPLPPS